MNSVAVAQSYEPPTWALLYDLLRRSLQDVDLKRSSLASLVAYGNASGGNFYWRVKNGSLLVISPAEGAASFLTVGWTCFTEGEWEPNIERCLPALLRPDDHAIDVGANLGYFTMALARLLPDGMVYAFEPLPSTFERLCAGCTANGVTENVTLFRDALSSMAGTGQLFAHETATGNASLVRDLIARLARPCDVRLKALDTLYEEGAIPRADLIKIDVEGHEFEVLRGGRRMIEHCRPHLILEFNERMSRLAGWGRAELASLIQSMGSYEFYRIDKEALTYVDLPSMPIERNTHLDLLAVALDRPRPELAGLRQTSL